MVGTRGGRWVEFARTMSWLRFGRSVYDPAVEPRSRTELRVPRLIRPEASVVMFSVLPGQPSTVAYSTVLSLLRVNRMSWLVPSRGVVKEPPPICVGPSP